MKEKPEELTTVLVTDCGSTTTKALLFQKVDGEWKTTARGEAPTTVEEPIADVTQGALNAFLEIQEITGRTILSDDTSATHPFVIAENKDSKDGIDLYLSTSSAGGGLQMLVGGVVKQITTESAERAALGAGAIVLDALSADDGREDFERIERIRHIKPDIVLITGGVNGGTRSHVIEMAEILRAADPRPRFGETLTLPVIYAGNIEAAEEVAEILAPLAQVSTVANVRPTLEEETLGPAREAIHEFFLSHVMSHSPGYDRLLKWTPIPVMPTPAAVGDIVQTYAISTRQQVLCADIGGATTDVFSVFYTAEGKPAFNRTVSANLGMSYSVANVMVEAGVQSIMRWLPYDISDHEVRDRLRNKMIRPTSIPQTLEDLWLEQAICREALRLSLIHHRSLAVGLSGVQKQRGISDIFSQDSNRSELVNMMELDLVIGSGGVLSHAPHRLSSAMMMLDGFGLEGLTEITVDSIFMMPHLGVLASVHPEASKEIFERDCLVRICHAIVPVHPERKRLPEKLATIYVDGEAAGEVLTGKVGLLSLPENREVTITITPAAKYIDVGAGPGEAFEKKILTAPHGLLLDGRNRPLRLPEPGPLLQQHQYEIYEALGIGEGR